MDEQIKNAAKILPNQWKVQLCRRLKAKKIMVTRPIVEQVIEKGETPKFYLEILEEFANMVQEVSQKKNDVFKKLEGIHSF